MFLIRVRNEIVDLDEPGKVWINPICHPVVVLSNNDRVILDMFVTTIEEMKVKMDIKGWHLPCM